MGAPYAATWDEVPPYHDLVQRRRYYVRHSVEQCWDFVLRRAGLRRPLYAVVTCIAVGLSQFYIHLLDGQ